MVVSNGPASWGAKFQIGLTVLNRGTVSLAGSVSLTAACQGLLSLCGLCPGALAWPQWALGSVYRPEEPSPEARLPLLHPPHHLPPPLSSPHSGRLPLPCREAVWSWAIHRALAARQWLQGQPQKGGVTVETRVGSLGVGGVWPPPSTPPCTPWRHLHS